MKILFNASSGSISSDGPPSPDVFEIDSRIPNGNREFQVFKTSSQVTPSTFATIINWDTPSVISGSYSFNSTTGILTFGQTGLYEISAVAQMEVTGNNRIEGGLVLFDTAIWSLSEARQYNARNNTQNTGDVVIPPILYKVDSITDTIRLQHNVVGTTTSTIMARLVVKRLGDLADYTIDDSQFN